MVTRILFDPRRDLPDGTTITADPVTLEATPTGVRENGSVVILPSTLSFTVNTAADVVELAPPAASWCWRIVVRQGGVVKQQRTVRFDDVASIAYTAMVDVDPATLGETTGHARQWDATFWQITQLIAAISVSSGGGNTGFEVQQTFPAATWGPIAHPFGRRASVTVYDANGDEIAPDIHSTTTTVSLVFANPVAGTAVLN